MWEKHRYLTTDNLYNYIDLARLLGSLLSWEIKKNEWSNTLADTTTIFI